MSSPLVRVVVVTFSPGAALAALLDSLPAIRLEVLSSTTSPTGSLLVDYRVIG